MTNAFEIDGRRLWDSLMASASIGATPNGGLRRLALTDDDKTMRDLFVRWCSDAGCVIKIDRVGNIFARRAGLDATLKPVLVGSHLDTQIAGGRFDGVLGVLAGLEVVRTLNDRGIETRRAVELVCWTNEEGVRFQPPMMGAGAFAGVHTVDWVLAQRDDAGVMFGAELERIGYAGEHDRVRSDVDSYFELHIEQGPILDEEGVHVGIVTGGFTSFGAEIRFRGENAHSGATPMKARKDALVAAAITVAKVNEIGWSFAPAGRATSARIDISPNRYGIVADKAELTIDVRHPDPAAAREMYAQILEAMAVASKQGRVESAVTREWSFGGISFDAGLVNLIRSVAAELDVSHKHILSAAGHDAYHVARIAPAAMIFCPCTDGITHNEAEHIELATTVPAVNVLLNSVLRRAKA
jgi:beta-ureidopropionase / N-carbamoyl-L-amino-acid hydrolase